MDIAEVRDILFSLLDRRQGSYGSADVRSVLVSDAPDWRNYLTRIAFTDEQHSSRGTTLAYKDTVFRETSVAVGDTRALLAALFEQGILRVADRAVRFHAGGAADRLDFYGPERLSTQVGRANPIEWPTWHVNLGTAQLFAARLGYEPLAASALPFYPDVTCLVADRMGIPRQLRHPPGRLLIYLPDYRARIRELKVGARNLSLQLDLGTASANQVLVKVFAADDSATFTETVPVNDMDVAVSLPFTPSHAHVCLLSLESDEIIDDRRFGPYTQGAPPVAEPFSPEYLTGLILEGEGLTVEFKPGTGDDRAKEEWAETAVAFANAQGGILLIGVKDDAQVEGWFGGPWNDSIISSVRDKTEPPVNVEVLAVPVGQKPVYVVRVPESGAKPHFIRGKGPYIRSGSTDRPMTRHELDEIIGQKQRASQPFSGTLGQPF